MNYLPENRDMPAEPHLLTFGKEVIVSIQHRVMSR